MSDQMPPGSSASDWRIYYHDEDTFFGSTRSDWLEAPSMGILAVVVPDEYVGEVIDHGLGFYAWPLWAEFPMAMDPWGILDLLLNNGFLTQEDKLIDLPLKDLFNQGVKLGRSLSNADWRERYSQIASERKGGKLAHERPAPE